MLFELKKILIERGMTQAKLAASVGISPPRMCRILRGGAKPQAGERLRIAEVLTLPINEMRRFFPPRRARKAGR